MLHAIRASQIECERVCSLAGMVTQSLRNTMGVGNMATEVFIHKNVDLVAQVDAALSYSFG